MLHHPFYHLMLSQSAYPYTAYFCEENIWQLADSIRSESAKVVFISNSGRRCALWNQKLASSGEPVVWDYHVVLMEGNQGGWFVYDFDSVLPWGISLQQYLANTFDESVDVIFQPRFRVITASDYLKGFQSDRRHMRDRHGSWLKPPPKWPVISSGSMHNLDQFIAMDESGPGEVYDLINKSELPL